MKNYYEILEVNKKASKEVIEKAYKVLVKKYHPDQYRGEKQIYAETKLKEINEAYRVLSDEFLKEQYDIELEKEMENFYARKYQKENQKSTYRQYEEDSKQSNTNGTTNRRRYVNKNDVENEQHSKSNNYNEKPAREMTKEEKREYRRKMSTLSGAIELTKELYANRPRREEIKEMTKKDIIAIILTIIVIILLGVALWFIPFTNGWMRELIFENPLVNWIINIFSR